MGEPEGEKLLERPRRTSEDNFKMEIEWGAKDWVYVAQDKGQWRAVVKTKMNLRVPCSFGELLSSWATGGSAPWSHISEDGNLNKVTFVWIQVSWWDSERSCFLLGTSFCRLSCSRKWMGNFTVQVESYPFPLTSKSLCLWVCDVITTPFVIKENRGPRHIGSCTNRPGYG